jgi:hypothetical protein
MEMPKPIQKFKLEGSEEHASADGTFLPQKTLQHLFYSVIEGGIMRYK